jgi:hypothetical protein
MKIIKPILISVNIIQQTHDIKDIISHRLRKTEFFKKHEIHVKKALSWKGIGFKKIIKNPPNLKKSPFLQNLY